MKKLTSAFIITLMLSNPVTSLPVFAEPAQAEQAISITINDVKQNFDVPPLLENGRVMVPMRYIFEELGAAMEWNQDTQTVLAKKEDKEIQVKIGSFFAKKNNATLQLDVKPRIVQGRTMVPLRFVSEALGASVDWQPETKAVTVSTASSSTTVPEDVEKDEKILTYEEAVNLALKQDYRIESAKVSLERAEIVRDRTAQGFTDSTPGGPGYGAEDLLRLQSLQSLLRQDSGIKVANKQIDLAQESIVFEVQSLFDEIIDLEEQIFISDLKLQDMKSKLEVTKIKMETGMESKHKYSNDLQTYNQEVKTKEVLAKSLNTSYIKLNTLIGFKEEERYAIERKELHLDSIANLDIETHISRAISTDPYLWIQEQTIKNNENSLKLYTYNANQEPYKATQLDLQKSKTDLANMKEKLRKSLLLKYNQLNQLEEKYKVTELQLAQVEQNLNIMRKQFDLGMITRLELNDLELSAAQLQYSLDAMAIQHKTLKTTLEKPYLVPDYV